MTAHTENSLAVDQEPIRPARRVRRNLRRWWRHRLRCPCSVRTPSIGDSDRQGRFTGALGQRQMRAISCSI